MAMKVRVLLGLLVTILMLTFAGCGHYVCHTTFGGGSCTSSGGGIGTGGNTGGNAAAYLYVAVGGGVDGIAYNPAANTFLEIPNFTSPLTANVPPQGMAIAQKKYLYTGTPQTGQIWGFSIGSGGSLTTISNSPFNAAYLIAGTPIGTQVMVTNPAGTLLFVPNAGGDSIYVYQIGSGGALTAVNTTGFSVPFAPSNLAVDGLGKYLYVNPEFGGGQMAAFSIGSDGSLTPVTGSPFTLSVPITQVQSDPSGKFLIGTTGSSTDSHLYVYSITQSGANAGAIAPVSGSPFATVYTPFQVAVQPNVGGNLVYSFSINESSMSSIFSNPVEGYRLDPTTGALTAVTGSPFTSVVADWGQFDQSGSLLFAFDTYKTVMYGTNVGSDGSLTPTLSVGFFDDPWAVVDAQ